MLFRSNTFITQVGDMDVKKGISISMIFYCGVKRCNCKVKEVTGYFSANHIIGIFYHVLITIRSTKKFTKFLKLDTS